MKLTEAKISILDFKKMNGLIPAIIQDSETAKVYMLGYVNKESLGNTFRDNYVWFWSRSRKELWLKGASSGNKLRVKEIFTDCDRDSLIIKVKLEGENVCHTGSLSCFD